MLPVKEPAIPSNKPQPARAGVTAPAKPKDFSEIVREHSDFVYNVALRMTGNPHEAEDATQEAFISAYRAYHRFRGESAITTWLYRITVNAVLMKRRKQKREREATQASLEDRDMPDKGGGPEKAALGSELKEVIQQGLDQLPPDLRMAVILRDVQGLSGEEAAEVLGVEVSTLKTRLHRGRMRLREYLSRYLAS